jgi:hypothetical protein
MIHAYTTECEAVGIAVRVTDILEAADVHWADYSRLLKGKKLRADGEFKPAYRRLRDVCMVKRPHIPK